ncbi:SAV_6107 family HEPN domain-containing protein [Nonomuraea sp. NPDC048826]|uniref:SAV_6107 family HEPN domain-containing protein n=1 Tax=Nonomuraea sp. NPDC048826 TaxID=3364347 RepID=UPI00371C9279
MRRSSRTGAVRIAVIRIGPMPAIVTTTADHRNAVIMRTRSFCVMVIEPVFVEQVDTERDRNYVRPCDVRLAAHVERTWSRAMRFPQAPTRGQAPRAKGASSSSAETSGRVLAGRGEGKLLVRPARRKCRWGLRSLALPVETPGVAHDSQEVSMMAPRPRETPGPRLSPAVRAHLTDSRSCLAEAATARSPASRYVSAHLAALRAAAAILAARPQPTQGRRRRLRSAWELLPEAEPSLAEWAAYFAASAAKRAAAEAGMVRGVTAADADEIMAEAETFVCTVEGLLGVPSQPQLPVDVPLAG